eukprot:SAG11_NODE_14747_length_601_cov_0.719124_1_plen_76_part_10
MSECCEAVVRLLTVGTHPRSSMSSECGQRFAAIVVVLGLLSGLAMTATGVSLTLSAPDAGEDFSALESKCVITNVF